MTLYAESSAVLAWLLGEEAGVPIRDLLAHAEHVVASDLTLVESDRVLIRAVVLGELDEATAADRRAIECGGGSLECSARRPRRGRARPRTFSRTADAHARYSDTPPRARRGGGLTVNMVIWESEDDDRDSGRALPQGQVESG